MSEKTTVPPTTPSSERQVLTVREAAALLDVNVKTLYAEIKARRFPAIRLGRTIRISRTVVVAMGITLLPDWPAAWCCCGSRRQRRSGLFPNRARE